MSLTYTCISRPILSCCVFIFRSVFIYIWNTCIDRCIYVCMCIYICIYVFDTHMYVTPHMVLPRLHFPTCFYIRTEYIYRYIYIYMYMYMYMYLYLICWIRTYISRPTWSCRVFIFQRVFIYTRNTCAYIYTYVCVYGYVSMCLIHTCISHPNWSCRVFIFPSVSIYIWNTCIDVYIYVCVYVYIYIYVGIHMEYMCRCKNICVCMCIHIYVSDTYMYVTPNLVLPCLHFQRVPMYKRNTCIFIYVYVHVHMCMYMYD